MVSVRKQTLRVHGDGRRSAGLWQVFRGGIYGIDYKGDSFCREGP